LEAKILQSSEKLREELDEHAPSWSHREVLGVELWQALSALAFLVAGYVLKKISNVVVAHAAARYQSDAKLRFDYLFLSAAGKPLGYLILLGGVAGAAYVLPLPGHPPNLHVLVFAVFKVLLVADVLWFLFRIVDVLVQHLTHVARRTGSRLDDQILPLISKSLKVIIALVCAVWVVQLLGYSVTSLLAGLGIGGLAVALALQDALANFFGSVFILLDRPFRVGDMVKIREVQGKVEEIGLRSTRIRTLAGTLVYMPNKMIAESVVDNLSQVSGRQVTHSVRLPRTTEPHVLDRAVDVVREALGRTEGVDPASVTVHIDSLPGLGADIKISCLTTSADFEEQAAARDRIAQAVAAALARENLVAGPPPEAGKA
jgi:MscS family membrane protein